MEVLLSHRSIRNFLEKPVSDEILNEILECGIRSSNTGNMQLYSVIVTRNPENKALLAPFHFNQPMVKSAPLILTICFDINRFLKWCKINGTVTNFSNILWLLNGTIDSSILAQNICVAAENLGLGICYLGTTLYCAPEISKVLNLPQGVVPVTTLVIGYPEIIPELVDRLPLSAVIHFEEYQNYTADRISELYKEKENLVSSFNFIKENDKDNLAQVYAEVRYKSSDNQFFNNKLVEFLKEQILIEE
jgi:nitroreductase